MVYTTVGWPKVLKTDIYQPRAPEKGEAKTLHPAILLIHGGGWTGGDKRWQMRGIARKLAKNGYVVMNATYRTSPEWLYPSPVQDLGEALKWLHANADRLGVDRDRVGTYGYSAGAHLASLMGLKEDNALDLKAVVAGGTPANLMLFEDGELVVKFIGGTRAEKTEAYRDASPVNHVHADSPPFFLYHGTDDELVPPEQAKVFYKKLQENGVPVTLQWVEGKGHIGTFLFPDGAEDNAVKFLNKYLK